MEAEWEGKRVGGEQRISLMLRVSFLLLLPILVSAKVPYALPFFFFQDRLPSNPR